MTYEQERTTVQRDVVEPARVVDPVAVEPARVGERPTHQVITERNTTEYRPSGSTVAARIVVVVFGIVQVLLLLRIVLLALDARRGNDLVAAILNVSQPLVAPFEGMFRTDSLSAGGSVLDIAAISALVVLTIVELVILAILRIPRRSAAI